MQGNILLLLLLDCQDVLQGAFIHPHIEYEVIKWDIRDY